MSDGVKVVYKVTKLSFKCKHGYMFVPALRVAAHAARLFAQQRQVLIDLDLRFCRDLSSEHERQEKPT